MHILTESSEIVSRKAAFEDAGIRVCFKNNGLGMNNGVIDVFSRYMQDAIDIIQGCPSGRHRQHRIRINWSRWKALAAT